MKIKLIGETAWHHEGDYQYFNDLIDRLIKSPVDIIKIHITVDFNEYMSQDHEHYQLLKKYLLSTDEWTYILSKIKNSDKELMVLVNDKKAIDLAKKFDPKYYEIHAVCLNDIHLLNHLSESLKPENHVVFGIGGSTIEEIQDAIEYIKTKNIILVYGFQNYPTKYHLINFIKLKKYLQLFPEFAFGYADHTSWDHEHNELITMFGAAMGVEYIEKHVTSYIGKKRTDYSAAISFEMIDSLKEKLNILSECMGDGKFQLNSGEKAYSEIGPMKKAPILIKDVRKGHKLSWTDIAFQRTNRRSDIKQVEVKFFINKTFISDCNKGQILTAHLFK
jgi:sialic acid synthase SpsE